MRRTTRSAEDLRAVAAVARGDAPADLYLEGGQLLNVYSGEVLAGNVAIARGRVAYVGGRRTMVGPETQVVPVGGRVLVPGYIDPHCHPTALYNPVTLAAAVLPLGTTAVVADTLFLMINAARDRVSQLMLHLAGLPLRYYWFLRLHAQAHHPEEERLFALDTLRPLLDLDEVRTAGEVTRWPDLHGGDPLLTDLIAEALARGRRVEGHMPGVSAERLQALVAAGISSDHEAITAEQALERLRAGLYVMLRHSSIRLDIPALALIASEARAFSGRLMLTPDGPDPTFVVEAGFMDHLIAVAVTSGIPPAAAYQMATINPASYYSLDEELGGIAPGRRADINVLTDLSSPRPAMVIAGGRVVAEQGALRDPLDEPDWNVIFPRKYAPTWDPQPALFTPPPGPIVPAMHLENDVITRRRDVDLSAGLPSGVQMVALLDPAGRWMSRGLLSGFADRLEALACTYTVASCLMVIGDSPEAMARAARRALDLGGGIVLVEAEAVRDEFPLPIAGIMSREPMPAVASRLARLRDLLVERGYRHRDPAYTLLFLGFDSLPDIRLTHRGVWDVKSQRVLIPRLDLT